MNRIFHSSLGNFGAVACATLLFVGCGGSDLTEAEAEAREEAQKQPVTLPYHGPNVVARWHDVAGIVTAVAPSPAGATPEERRGGPDMTTVQLAVYDAVVAIAGGYKPYAVTPKAPTAGASAEAAANEAAYRVLLGLFPSRSALYQPLYDAILAEIAAGDAKARGMAVGAEVAQAMLALRANDGRSVVLSDYVPGTEAGDFRGPTPVNRQAPYIKPFALTSLAQYRPAGPPALGSGRYAADFEEVKAYGGAVSTVRTAEQLETALFHTAPPGRNIPTNLQQFATSYPSLVDNARVMAALWTAIGDAGNACFEAKYHFNFWRPQSAIPLA
ncbi:MAG TPA: vanadium-dependent haloperoxidase, partial [Burkholderiaceae bacterium]